MKKSSVKTFYVHAQGIINRQCTNSFLKINNVKDIGIATTRRNGYFMQFTLEPNKPLNMRLKLIFSTL